MGTIVKRIGVFIAIALSISTSESWSEVPTRASNINSIVNTRHNMTQSFLGGDAGWMGLSRNDYGEVCVYCHTPHGANQNIELPLWNRTINTSTYRTYDQLGSSSLTQEVSQPGTASLGCLSCHDGTIAVDSIINMPGSDNYSPSQATSQDLDFLDSWPIGPAQWGGWGGHGTLEASSAAFNRYGECQSCHSGDGPEHDPNNIPQFDIAYISTDLTNDHPVGVTYPTPRVGIDFNPTTGSSSGAIFYDRDGDNHADSNEVRFYNDGGTTPKVECASCHDPHGVPSAGEGSVFVKTFLRINNQGSILCQTCHVM